MDISIIISGVLVFVLGQAVLHFVFKPIKDFYKQRGDTSYLLLQYQAESMNASALEKEDRAQIHEMGAALISTVAQIPFYNFLNWIGIFGLPAKEDVEVAAQEINGIAHSLRAKVRYGNSPQKNVIALAAIGKCLKISTSFSAL